MTDKTSNVTEFTAKLQEEDFLVGPFSEYKVKVQGRMIPRLTGWREGDLVWLCVDHRFAACFSNEYALNAATLIAQALAIGEGYPHLGAASKEMPFAPLGVEISTGDLP